MRIPGIEVTVGRPVGSVRVHSSSAAGDPAHPSHAAVVRLLDLQEREAQRRRTLETVATIAGALRGRLDEVATQVGENLEQVAAIAVELGLTVAREVVGGAVERGLVDPTPIVERCLEQAVVGAGDDRPRIHVRMHPEDLGIWTRETGRSGDGVSLDASPELDRGEVVVTTGAGQLHYDPREVLERLSDAIRSGGFADEFDGPDDAGAGAPSGGAPGGGGA